MSGSVCRPARTASGWSTADGTHSDENGEAAHLSTTSAAQLPSYGRSDSPLVRRETYSAQKAHRGQDSERQECRPEDQEEQFEVVAHTARSSDRA